MPSWNTSCPTSCFRSFGLLQILLTLLKFSGIRQRPVLASCASSACRSLAMTYGRRRCMA